MAEIDAAYRDLMNAIARTIDEAFNGPARGKGRKIGFTLLVYPFGVTDQARCNFISNGANRQDIAVLFREMAARFEGQAEPSDGQELA